MSEKEKLLRVRVLECIDRLKTVIELNGPSSIIGEMAYSVWATTLAAYGEEAGRAMIHHMRNQNLQDRAVCTWGDCVGTIERTPEDICEVCQKEIGCDEESLKKIDEEAKKLAEECDGCDGTGLMEGWNHRDGNSCPKCKGTGEVKCEF